MAYTKASEKVGVMGDRRYHMFVMTSDAASGAVDTAVGTIDAVFVSPKSANTAGPKFKANLNSGGTALNGTLFVSSTTSGDDFYVIVYGR